MYVSPEGSKLSLDDAHSDLGLPELVGLHADDLPRTGGVYAGEKVDSRKFRAHADRAARDDADGVDRKRRAARRRNTGRV